MKSLTTVLTLAVLSTTVLGSVIPRDDAPVGIASVVNAATSSDNASPHPHPLSNPLFLPHPLSLLYPRADDEEQDVHTMATTFCKRCSDAEIDCANSCKHTSQCEIICQGVHVDGKLCKKECSWTQ